MSSGSRYGRAMQALAPATSAAAALAPSPSPIPTTTGIDARRNAYLDLLGFRRDAFAVTLRAGLAASARSLAIGTGLRKLKPSALFLNLPVPVTGRANHDRTARVARALTARALLGTINR